MVQFNVIHIFRLLRVAPEFLKTARNHVIAALLKRRDFARTLIAKLPNRSLFQRPHADFLRRGIAFFGFKAVENFGNPLRPPRGGLFGRGIVIFRARRVEPLHRHEIFIQLEHRQALNFFPFGNQHVDVINAVFRLQSRFPLAAKPDLHFRHFAPVWLAFDNPFRLIVHAIRNRHDEFIQA